jgi:hypothetical protein
VSVGAAAAADLRMTMKPVVVAVVEHLLIKHLLLLLLEKVLQLLSVLLVLGELKTVMGKLEDNPEFLEVGQT